MTSIIYVRTAYVQIWYKFYVQLYDVLEITVEINVDLFKKYSAKRE